MAVVFSVVKENLSKSTAYKYPNDRGEDDIIDSSCKYRLSIIELRIHSDLAYSNEKEIANNKSCEIEDTVSIDGDGPNMESNHRNII